MKFILKGKNANAFMITGFKESLKRVDQEIRTLKKELSDLAPEAPLRMEDAINSEIKRKESDRATILESIQSLESQ